MPPAQSQPRNGSFDENTHPQDAAQVATSESSPWRCESSLLHSLPSERNQPDLDSHAMLFFLTSWAPRVCPFSGGAVNRHKQSGGPTFVPFARSVDGAVTNTQP